MRTEAGAPTIHYALSAIKGVGEAQAEALVDARRARAFASLGDMAARLDPRAVNKKALESLAAAGAFDCLEPNRAAAFAGDRADAGDRQSRRDGESRRPERAVRRSGGARRSGRAPRLGPNRSG